MSKMELTPAEIRLIEKSEGYFIIGVKEGKHFTIAKGVHESDETNIGHITQGMLGCINTFLKQGNQGNGLILVALVVNAIKSFPELLKKPKK